VLERMSGVPGLVCGLLYGTGMRLTECLSLRVKDIDLASHPPDPRTTDPHNPRYHPCADLFN
jgi:integrase